MAIHRVGDVEVDAGRYEVRRGGRSVALEKNPMELLLLLLERRGQLVGREEIAKRLWGEGFALEIDAGINTAIRKIRVALGDGVVKTVVGKGYRVDAAAGAGHSIAVLPFDDLSGDGGQAWFADGVTDALITQLARFRRLRVISRTSALQYRGSKLALPEIARQLGVESVVEGSVTRAGGRVRITAQLIEARTDAHLWAESYDRELGDMLAVQAEVAGNVARRILVALSPEEASEVAPAGAVDAQAYDLCLRGRALWGKRNEAALDEAVALFGRAVQLDPGFASAWAGLADALAALGYASLRAPSDVFPRAKAAAQRALSTDPAHAEANAALAYCALYYDWDYASAEASFRRALASGSSATAHHWYSVLLTALGRFDEAREQLGAAVALDPLSLAIRADAGFESYYAGRLDEAAAQLRGVLRDAPQFPPAHLWLGRVYQQQRRFDDAVEAFSAVERSLGDWPVAIAAKGHALGAAGRRKEAAGQLRRLEALRAKRYVTPYGIALVQEALGDADAAFRSLAQAVDDRSNWLVWLALDPRLASLRPDPRFDALLARVGLKAARPPTGRRGR